jgi:hypothetical protein
MTNHSSLVRTLWRHAPTRACKRWRFVEDEEIIWLAVSGCLDHPAQIPLAVSLNLGPTIAERASFDWLRRRLIYHLKRALGRLPTCIIVWGVTGSRLHVHGAILARGTGEQHRIEAALLTAAGEWGSREHKDRQLKLKPIYSEGWASYMALHLRRCRNAPNGGWSMTDPMRDLAKKAFDKKVNDTTPKHPQQTHRKK